MPTYEKESRSRLMALDSFSTIADIYAPLAQLVVATAKRCPLADEASRLAAAVTQKMSSKQRLAKNFLMLQRSR